MQPNADPFTEAVKKALGGDAQARHSKTQARRISPLLNVLVILCPTLAAFALITVGAVAARWPA